MMSYELATLSRKHDLSVRFVVALVSVSNSEFSEIRGIASFAYTRCKVFRVVTRISQEKRITKTAGKARNLDVYLLCRLHVALA